MHLLTRKKHFGQVNPSYYDLVVMDIRMPGLNGLQLLDGAYDSKESFRYLFHNQIESLNDFDPDPQFV
jgi:DNA-binding NarL/FixJ family response regulator